MSVMHILNTAGGVYCGQQFFRGFVSLKDYQQLVEQKKLPTQIKTSVLHTCDFRRGATCSKAGNEASCKRVKFERSRVCMGCESRAGR